jgi:hypothetical protein
MSAKRPRTITLSEVEKAVTAALQQIQRQQTAPGEKLAKTSLIMGRWERDRQIPQSEADVAAREITKQVSTHVAGLNADPFAVVGPGGTTMGFVLREE